MFCEGHQDPIPVQVRCSHAAVLHLLLSVTCMTIATKETGTEALLYLQPRSFTAAPIRRANP